MLHLAYFRSGLLKKLICKLFSLKVLKWWEFYLGKPFLCWWYWSETAQVRSSLLEMTPSPPLKKSSWSTGATPNTHSCSSCRKKAQKLLRPDPSSWEASPCWWWEKISPKEWGGRAEKGKRCFPQCTLGFWGAPMGAPLELKETKATHINLPIKKKPIYLIFFRFF